MSDKCEHTPITVCFDCGIELDDSALQAENDRLREAIRSHFGLRGYKTIVEALFDGDFNIKPISSRKVNVSLRYKGQAPDLNETKEKARIRLIWWPKYGWDHYASFLKPKMWAFFRSDGEPLVWVLSLGAFEIRKTFQWSAEKNRRKLEKVKHHSPS